MASHSLSFLRPMALPRPATINHFLRRYTSEAAPSKVPKTSPTAATTSQLPKPRINVQTSPKPYTITKTPSAQYPIYTLKKRGGNMKLTKIRKIEGDLAALKSDLIMALKVEEKEVTINQLTRHILVKGHKRPEIESFLKSCESKAVV